MAVLILAAAVLIGTLACIAFMAVRGGTPFVEAISSGCSFFHIINLVWFVVRFVSVATDQSFSSDLRSHDRWATSHSCWRCSLDCRSWLS